MVLLPLPASADSLGARIALALPVGFLLAGVLASLPRLRWTRSLAWGGKGRAAALAAVSLVDWLLAWVVFHLAVSGFHGGIPATLTLRAFFLGQLAGMVSFIPGGLGTADAVWILTLAGAAGGHDRILAGLLLYRCVYYVLPWLFATLTLAGHMVRTGPRFGWLLRSVIASYTFLCGVVLLASAATPSLADRAAFLNRTVPLAVVEISHGASVVLGFLMLIVARGLMRGYRSSHRIALALFFGGALATFLKGLDYEEALLALVAAACLVVFRRAFERKGSMHASLEFALPVGVFAIVLFVAIGVGSFAALPAPGAALTTFAPFAQDTRFMRALFVLVSIAVLLVALLAQRARSRDRLPAPEEIARAVDEARSLGRSTNPLLVAVGDKSVFRPAPAGFMAYRTVGPFLVAFSEPVCPGGKEREFLAAFLDFAAEQDRDAVLYQITPALLPAAHDLGFSFFKLGEEGIVDLGRFDLKGNKAKGLRSSVNRVEKAGGRFELVEGAAIEALLPELREVSDAWLAAKGASEKWFSIGRFDEAYLRRFPCAVVRDGQGRIAAFANILEGAGGGELSFDLMRYRGDNVMDYLFVRLMLHAKERGFSRFNLGMAPLSAVGEDRRARPFERLARLLFRHGEHWYNYQGLRRYKEKFDPVWEPRYMAYPSPWQWPVAIANVTVLISGGWRALLLPARRPAA